MSKSFIEPILGPKQICGTTCWSKYGKNTGNLYS